MMKPMDDPYSLGPFNVTDAADDWWDKAVVAV